MGRSMGFEVVSLVIYYGTSRVSYFPLEGG